MILWFYYSCLTHHLPCAGIVVWLWSSNSHGDWAKKENKEIFKNKIERLSVQYVSSLNTMFLFIGSVTWNFLVVIMEWSNLGVSGTFNLTYPWFYIARWDYTPSFVLPIATLFLRWILMLRENEVFYGHSAEKEFWSSLHICMNDVVQL